MAQTSRKVKVEDLTPGMIIEEITELSFDYASLDEKGLKFIQSAFKGATAVLVKESGTAMVPVEELNLFDPLQSLLRIPSGLKSVRVVPGMANALEKRGMLEFKVVEGKPGGPAIKTEEISSPPETLEIGSQAAKQRFEARREEVKKFVDTIGTASENREKSSATVEDMLDNGRNGKYSSKGVEVMVDSILQTGSSPAMKAIAGLRGSDQTYAHCTDMSVILQECYLDVQLRGGKDASRESARFTLLAGFMHDIGKSEVPKDILESTTRFAPDSQEMIIMRNHTTYGARILNEMGMKEHIINVAHYHHVKRDDTMLTSYPDVGFDKVLPLTRLSSITDVYQALIGKRKYKKNWVPGKAIEYLISLKGTEFDERMLQHFIDAMGLYPLGSLVRLSTGDLGFVLSLAPLEHPERPIVAVVENAKGELLSSHSLMDLMLEPDIRVVEVVDHYEHYDESEDQAYNIFQSIRVD